ncbi:VirB4 family type IV secretion/conjugal transfer ATPase [Helicobacter suis]|uniref:DNA transfer protein n=3 Tax=Helicobacter suis TaxID=104628 RepID=E7G5E6_9HELI|nr:FtsK/SpoIIIE domain-containing protein [Helicobacter suis]EFX41405.1 DNA transfer protein [Helicobacter suis HS5]BCD46422.1 VirB4 homolog (VirB4) [Helicobacter suis]BCD47669.1 VirB4 homolog (VirB4) [Helicobacter suis]BCD51459.1 VirB4 homolog (VirB4) [Helicobacter suis]BCD70754.1 VirB4 homolog (VirB4) [Helicobacter suis]
MFHVLWDFLYNKTLDLLVGALPKVHCMTEENNILGLYDARFLLTKSEQLVGMLQIEGLSANAMAKEELQGYFQSKQNALDQLQGVVLRVHTKRRKLQLKHDHHLSNPYAQSILNQFENKTIYENTYTLIFETTKSPIKDFLEQKKLEITTSASKQLYEHQAKLLSDCMSKITHALQPFKPKPLTATQALNFYAEFINGFFMPLKPTLGFLEDSYIATNVHFKKDYYIQEYHESRVHNRILGIKAYASKTLSSLVFTNLLHQEKELDIIFSIEPLETQKALSFIQEKIRLTISSLVKQELQEYYERIQAKQLCLQKIACNLILRHPHLETLNQETQEVLSLLSNGHLVGVVETLGLRPAYFSFFPGRLHLNPRLRCQSSQALACLLVFEKPNRGFKSNSWGNMPLSVFKNLDHSPYLFNFHNQEVPHNTAQHSLHRANGHTMIIGATGTGKTTLMSFLMMSALKYDRLNILALDRAYGLFSYTHYFSGTYNSGTHFKINPLSLKNSKENIDFLHSFYAAMLNIPLKPQNQLDIQASNAISNTLKTLYATLPPQSFSLQDFKDAFIHTQALNLEPYLHNPLFNALEDSLEFKTPITTINMDAISTNPKDLGLLAYYIFYKILHQALEYNRGFLLFIDEFKSYAQNSILNTHINTLITQARKANGVVVLALQDTNQLNSIQDAASFIKNMGTLIFYPQKHIDSTALSRDFGIKLSHMEQHFLENTPMHAHQILVKNMGDGSSSIIDVNLQSLGPYLHIFNSNAGLAKHLQGLMQSYPETWREVFLQSQDWEFAI